MPVIPRQQVITFTVLGGKTADITTFTKYNHDKVMGVVVLPDKSVFGDHVFLEINKENVLPHGFDAGLIAFRQFLNKEMKRNVYSFEEWARGSEVRIMYRNNDKRSVNIDLILLTVQGDTQDITRRKKLQIVPVPYTKNLNEPCEIRTKTDFYYDELIGIFNDHFNYVQTDYDSYLATSELGKVITDFLTFMELPATTSADEKKKKKDRATALKTRIDGISYIPASVKELVDTMKKTLSEYLDDTTPEPAISQKNLFALQESVETFTAYNDNHRTLSTIELSVGGHPIYPEGYPIANVIPRYRKSFNETMHRCSHAVQEADIFIEFDYVPYQSSRQHIPTDFSIYFMYHQKSKKHVSNP